MLSHKFYLNTRFKALSEASDKPGKLLAAMALKMIIARGIGRAVGSGPSQHGLY